LVLGAASFSRGSKGVSRRSGSSAAKLDSAYS
jgi:hypothetical protein